ncbi:hypothetical protein IMZ48_45535 [Candidatus Bathyarchaeota archaeon]|nr:hypothetical protein [Candidatus Bathyarchaeota archaeon]
MEGRELKVFRVLFWSLMLGIVIFRTLITVNRTREILEPTLESTVLINRFHMGYFVSIASVECVSAYFLLRKLGSATRSLKRASLRSGIFSHLTRSSELRVATLAIIGTARAVMYCFQPSGVIADGTQSQVDRFLYTFECMFPVMML